jgi:hypothetical protein
VLETIVALAIKDNTTDRVWSSRWGIHQDLRVRAAAELTPAPLGRHVVDGFLTSEGRFVERGEAAVLARYAGQVLIGGRP